MDLLPREADDQVKRPVRDPIVVPAKRPRPERPIGDLRPHGRHTERCATQENKQPEEKHKPFLTITPPRARGRQALYRIGPALGQGVGELGQEVGDRLIEDRRRSVPSPPFVLSSH